MYYLHQGAFAFHILGVVFWIGGLVALSRVLRVFTKPLLSPEGEAESVLDGREDLYKACKMLWLGFSLGGLALVTITGMINISTLGFAYYMKQGWFHMKLTAVILLYVMTALTGLQLSKLSRGEPLRRKTLAMIHGITSGLTLIILLTIYFGRGVS